MTQHRERTISFTLMLYLFGTHTHTLELVQVMLVCMKQACLETDNRTTCDNMDSICTSMTYFIVNGFEGFRQFHMLRYNVQIKSCENVCCVL